MARAPAPPVTLWLGGEPPAPLLQAYEIAGRRVVTDLPLPELEPFRTAAEECDRGEFEPPSAARGELVHAGSTLLAGVRRPIECRRLDGGYRLHVGGGGRFTVERGPGGVVATRLDAGEAAPALTAAAVGPVLLLALALEDVWCLHASAVFDGSRAVAFAGASGTGKSTLAAGLERQPGPWRRLADDLLPITIEAARPVVLPRYPQLKIAARRQPALVAPSRLPLAAVHLLRRAGGGEVRAARARPAAAVAALARATFISFLLDGALLERQLDMLAAVAAEVPVRWLDLPHRREAIAAVAALLAGQGTA